MLPLEDPCYECLINVMCEQMCPKAIEYYKKRVRIRPKDIFIPTKTTPGIIEKFINFIKKGK